MRQHFTSGGQSIGASASVLPMNIQGWFPLRLTGLISLLSKGLSSISPTQQFESINSSLLSLLYGPTLTSIHDYWKNHSFDYVDFCEQSNISALHKRVQIIFWRALLLQWDVKQWDGSWWQGWNQHKNNGELFILILLRISSRPKTLSMTCMHTLYYKWNSREWK